MEETVLEVAARRANALALAGLGDGRRPAPPAVPLRQRERRPARLRGVPGFLHDGPVRWIRQTLEDAEVIETGPVAVLLATVVDDVVWNGEPARWTFVTTQTYVSDRDAWSYLAGHTAPAAA